MMQKATAAEGTTPVLTKQVTDLSIGDVIRPRDSMARGRSGVRPRSARARKRENSSSTWRTRMVRSTSLISAPRKT
jgi:hypothetical protein